MIMNYIRKLDNVNHFDNERHCCIKDCEFFKNEIAFCLRELVMPPQDRYLYEVTTYTIVWIYNRGEVAIDMQLQTV